MTRAIIGCLFTAVFIGCTTPELNIPPSPEGKDPVQSGVNQGGDKDGGTTDGGTDAGVTLTACDPGQQPVTCPQGSYCGCNNPTGPGANCYCYQGNAGDPCAAGNATCKAPNTCRSSAGLFWGKCGTGQTGDVCGEPDLCAAGHTCLLNSCIWGNCCS
jgi:hypothetical protein